MSKYKKENCCSKVRAVVKTKHGDVITLVGTHSHNWEIVTERDGRVVITSFPNREGATKEFKKFK